MKWCALVVTVIALVACESPPSELCAGAGGGKEERGQQASHVSAVLAIVGWDSDHARWYQCSGVLVAPTTVLTAAHCVHDRSGWTFHAYFVDDLALGRAESAPLAVSGWDVHPEFDPRGEGKFDVAVLKLATRAPRNPLPWTTGAPSNAVNVRYRFVGYGGPDGDVTRCLRFSNEVTDILSYSDPLLAFVHPYIYYGDSGGPLLLDLGSGPVVLGVYSMSPFMTTNVTRGNLAYFAKLRDDAWFRRVIPTEPVKH